MQTRFTDQGLGIFVCMACWPDSLFSQKCQQTSLSNTKKKTFLDWRNIALCHSHIFLHTENKTCCQDIPGVVVCDSHSCLSAHHGAIKSSLQSFGCNNYLHVFSQLFCPPSPPSIYLFHWIYFHTRTRIILPEFPPLSFLVHHCSYSENHPKG